MIFTLLALVCKLQDEPYQKKGAKMKILDYFSSSSRFKFKHGKGTNDGEF